MALRRLLYQAYWAIQRAIAPGLADSQDQYKDALVPHVTPRVSWLDVGCGHRILRSWQYEQEQSLANSCRSVVGVEHDLASLRKHRTIRLKVRADTSALPLESGSFDLVTGNMVVEHLSNPTKAFGEIARVLKVGGLFLFHTPNARSYVTFIARHIPRALKPTLIRLLEGRREEDLFRTFYLVNTARDIERVASQAGFEIQHLEFVCSTASLAMVLPLALVELVWLRLLLRRQGLASFRPNIICTLRKRTQSFP